MADEAPQSGLSGAEVRSLYQALQGQFSARNGEYARARVLYSGKHWGIDQNSPVPLGKHYTITINYLRPIIRRAVKDLLARMPGIHVIPPSADTNGRAIGEALEAILYHSWEKNDAETVFRRVAHNSALLRRGYLYVWWDPSEKCAYFRSLPPDNVYPVYDGDVMTECVVVTRRLTRELRADYPDLASQITEDRDTGFIEPGIGMPSRTLGGVTDALGNDGTGRLHTAMTGYTTVIDWYDSKDHWVRLMGDAEHHQTLGYGFGCVPIVEVPNDLPGDEIEPGTEIDDAVELNQYLDQLISQQADIIRKYANPTVLDKGSGQSPQSIQQTLASDGGVIPLKRDGDLGFLNWDGPQPAIGEQADRIQSYLFDLTRPASSYGQTVTNQSGVVTNMSLTPTVTDAEDRATIFGMALVRMNAWILRLYEVFMAGEEINLSTIQRDANGKLSPLTASVRGKDIAGWYMNRIVWPSMLRTDDPTYIQGIMSQVTSKPPLMSVYDGIEALGHEDSEARVDRIKAQLEDPRFHPDVLASAMSSAAQFSGAPIPGDLAGLDGGPPPPGAAPGGADLAAAAQAGGNPNRDQLASY